MKRRLKWSIALLVAVLVAVAIGRTLVARQAQKQAAAPAPVASALELGPADIVVASRRELVRSLRISGSLQAVDTAVVKAKAIGELRELSVREGDPVRAGQLLGRQDDTEYAARLRQALQQAESARAQLEIAERALANNRALVDRGFISRNALDTSVSNAASARANLLAAEAAADVARKARDDTVLRAPIAGQVSQRFAQPGERLGLDARILEIVDLSRIELAAAVAPESVGSVRIGAEASLQIDGIAEALAARVVRINPAAVAGTRAVTVYLEVKPHPALRHGLFATGSIELERASAVAVPESALRNDRSTPYLLAIEGDRIMVREVRLGPRGRAADGGDPIVAVESGIAEGAELLAGGVGVVEDGTPVRRAAAPAAAPVTPAAAAPSAR